MIELLLLGGAALLGLKMADDRERTKRSRDYPCLECGASGQVTGRAGQAPGASRDCYFCGGTGWRSY
ncbi:MAG: hypothetical protein ABIG71_04075 [Candidatus Uhrbacteria bacterium]